MAILKKDKIEESEITTKQEISANTKPGNLFAVKQPWITEKSHRMTAEGRYVFLVDKNANKSEVKKAVKDIYKVDPVSINMISIREKQKKFRGIKSKKDSYYKKAVITVKKGQKIDVMPSA